MREHDRDGNGLDRPSDGHRSGGYTLWAARHPVLSALLLSVVLTLLVFAKSALLAVASSRSPHSSGWRLWIGAAAIEAILFLMFLGLNTALARARRRSGTALTAEALDLPFVEDRDAANHRPPALLVLRPSMRTTFGLLTAMPLLAGLLSAIAAAVDIGSGHRAVLAIVMAPLWILAGAVTTSGHRRQRVVVDSDNVYVYTFTGRYRRLDRTRIAELRRTTAEPILAGSDGEQLARLPLGLTRGQTAELAQVLQVAQTTAR